jgi:hypothetical protein
MNDAYVVFFAKVFEKEYAKVINFLFLNHASNFLQTIIYYSKIFTMIQTLTSCAQRFCGLQRVWICVASSHHFLAFFCLLHFLMLNHKTEKNKK